ncbi:MAG: hypothetical protein Q4C41_09005, partial [Eggerthellaceae bacterium]|nr:hypothetical protein [Eggerthellaceae bacterium]
MEKHLQRAAIAGSLAGVLAVSTVPLQALASDTGSSTTPVEGNADGETASEHVQESTAVQSTATKDETVYVKADAEGAVEGAYAVNLFAAGSGEVTDAGTYASVKNLTTTQEIEQENGKITFDAADDEPFYYQGTLEGDVELPWDVSVAYYLDGERTSPDELAGATGRVRMEVSVEARTDAAGAGVADFANSYLVQLQGTFDTARLNVQAAEGATTAYVGNNTVVTCMALPGEGGSWTIEGDATDFSYDGWQVTALPLSLAVELADEDTAQLTDKISELESATAKLADGSSTLGDGAGTLAAGTSEVASGARDVAAGADDLASGAGNLASGARDAASGAAAVDSGAQELASGAAALGEGVGAAAAGAAQLATSGTQLLGGWDELAAGVESLQAGAAQIAAGSDAFAAALAAQQTTASDADLNSAISAYQTQLALVGNGEAETSTLAAYVQNIVNAATAYGGQVGANQALSSVSEQYATLAQGIDGVAAGVDSLATGAQSFDAGLRSYVGATSDLADGLESASAGVDAAVQGAASLAEGTSNLAA